MSRSLSKYYTEKVGKKAVPYESNRILRNAIKTANLSKNARNIYSSPKLDKFKEEWNANLEEFSDIQVNNSMDKKAKKYTTRRESLRLKGSTGNTVKSSKISEDINQSLESQSNRSNINDFKKITDHNSINKNIDNVGLNTTTSYLPSVAQLNSYANRKSPSKMEISDSSDTNHYNKLVNEYCNTLLLHLYEYAQDQKNKQLDKMHNKPVPKQESKCHRKKLNPPIKDSIDLPRKKYVKIELQQNETQDEKNEIKYYMLGKPPQSNEFKPGLRNCLFPNCDSKGHLSGLYDHHYTFGACPMFHNTTAQACTLRWKYRIMPLLAHLTSLTPYEKIDKSSENSNLSKKIDSRLHSQLSSPNVYGPNLKNLLGSMKIPMFGQTYGNLSAEKLAEISETFIKCLNDQSPFADEDKTRNSYTSPSSKMKENHHTMTDKFSDTLYKHPFTQIYLDTRAIVAAIKESDLEPFAPPFAVKRLIFGESWSIEGWYPSPFPLNRFGRSDTIYFCAFCLYFTENDIAHIRHLSKCPITFPPGEEIYREGPISIFEVDGRTQTFYCRNLCLLSKLFMESKTLCYEVQHFWFYVMTLADCYGRCHLIGYFSKEKQNFQKNTVSCLLILPHFMRKGYGWKLIDFSYLLARIEDKIGSPERPLSDHGLITYRSYWNSIILHYMDVLHNKKSPGHEDDKISIKDMSQETGVHPDDIISTMQYYRLLKSWRGNHIILKKELDALKAVTKHWKTLPSKVDAKHLRWTPH